jgi:hypothetical protein
MLQVIVVEKIDANPLTVCEATLIDDDADAGERTRIIVEKHNERSVVQAEGALVWGVGIGRVRSSFARANRV